MTSMRGLGTVLNVVAIAAGAPVGTLLGGRLPEGLRDTLVAALGLFTLALGVQQALAAFGDEVSRAVGRSAPLLVLGAFADGLYGDLGLLVVAIGLRLLGLARIRVANLLPAVLLAPLATGLVAAAR